MMWIVSSVYLMSSMYISIIYTLSLHDALPISADEFRPYFDNAPVYGHGPTLEEFTAQTPLTVGSPQQVIDRYAGMRELFGDRKSTRLNSSHPSSSYAVFCLKKKVSIFTETRIN